MIALAAPVVVAPVSRKTSFPWLAASLVVGGGAALFTALYYSGKRSVVSAVSGKGPSVVRLKLTGYWPFAAKTEAERKLEGGVKDRKGKPLHTLEQHRADPRNHPYVSLAGDDSVWPYGQRVVIPELGEDLIFRVVDTGGNFRGTGKLVRVAGHEPVDVCVDSKTTKLPKTATARVVPGDNFERGREVASANITPGAVLAGACYVGFTEES